MSEKNYIHAVLLSIAACFFFSLMAILIRFISDDIPPFEMIFFRNFFCLLLLLPWAYTRRSMLKITNKRVFALHCYRSISGVIGMCMFFYSLTLLPVTDTIALTFTLPLFTAILAVFFLKETLHFYRAAALLIGFLGAVIIIQPGTELFHFASLFALGSSLSWAITNIIVKKLTEEDSPEKILFYMMFFMTPLALPLALLDWRPPSLENLGWLLALAIVTNLAQYCMTHAYNLASMNHLLPFDFFRLIFSAIFAYLIFGEVIQDHTILGAVIIFGSAIYIVNRTRKNLIREAVD